MERKLSLKLEEGVKEKLLRFSYFISSFSQNIKISHLIYYAFYVGFLVLCFGIIKIYLDSALARSSAKTKRNVQFHCMISQKAAERDTGRGEQNYC